MKALVYHGPGQRAWDTVDDPASDRVRQRFEWILNHLVNSITAHAQA